MTKAKRTNRKQFALEYGTLRKLESMADYAGVSQNEIIHRAIDIAYDDCIKYDEDFKKFIEVI